MGASMTHVYRALWTDNSLSLIDELPREFSEWLSSRGTPIDLQENGVVVQGPRTAIWTSIKNENGRAVQLHLVEELKGTWITSVTAIWSSEENVLWADVSTEKSADEIDVVYAPRLTRNLLLGGGEPQIGCDSLEVQPREIDDQNALDELMLGLNDSAREIPYLIIRVGEGTERRLSIQRATRASETLAGLAQVFAIDEKSVRYLNGVLPSRLRLDEIGSRLLMPGALDDPDNADLTFFMSSVDLDDNQKTLGRLALGHIWRTEQWPSVYEHWDELKSECDEKREFLLAEFGDRGSLSNSGTLIRADEPNELLAEIERLRQEIQVLEEERVYAVLEAEEEAAKVERLLDQLVGRIIHEPTIELKKVRQSSISGTLEQLRIYATRVSIPPEAERSIDELDEHLSRTVWASDISQLIASMEAFAIAVERGDFNGNFLKWCTEKGTYVASKIAMKDSESTMSNANLRAARIFPVSKQLDASGQRLMESHVKIQPRGDGQIPRVYFYDDTKGPTKKMHIGFIGPHHLVPTSSF